MNEMVVRLIAHGARIRALTFSKAMMPGQAIGTALMALHNG